jgi:predicted dehydrogenase
MLRRWVAYYAQLTTLRRLGIGFVGPGWITNTFHVKTWRAIRNSDITAICGTDEKRARETARLCRDLNVGNPKIYTDVQKMVQDPNVNAVWITVPNYARVPVVKAITEESSQGKTELVGIACEKPLACNAAEAEEMIQMVEKAGLLHGYLENQVFMPSIMRGKALLWEKGAATAGRPYLVRCSEEHGGPHKAWFWDASRQGGGVLNDMLCHSMEAGRYLLTSPEERKEDLKPRTVTAEIATLKWARPEYVKKLKKMTQGTVDYSKRPAEDRARASIVYETRDGTLAVSELSSSWSFAPSARITMEMLGPEYYMQIDTLNPEMKVFFSREAGGPSGEEIVEKQTYEQGFMPVIPDEAHTYGYVEENRHIVESFLNGKMPRETWKDGQLVVELMMTCYLAAEKGRRISFPPQGLKDFVPRVAQGTWNPNEAAEPSCI